MSETTPGKWRACTDPQDLPQLLYSGLIASLFYSPDQYVAVVSDTHDVGDYAECCANAYLIAASPDLRDALLALAVTENGEPCWCPTDWCSGQHDALSPHNHTDECLAARTALRAAAPPQEQPAAAGGEGTS